MMPFAAWYALITTGGEFSFQVLFSSNFLPIWMILAFNLMFSFLLIRKSQSFTKKIVLDILNIIIGMSLLVAYFSYLPSVGEGVQIIQVLSSLFFTIPLLIHASYKLVKFKELLLVYIVSNLLSSVTFANILKLVIWKSEIVFATDVVALGFIVSLLSVLPGAILVLIILGIHKRSKKHN
jgi:hypothetical protein